MAVSEASKTNLNLISNSSQGLKVNDDANETESVPTKAKKHKAEHD